MINKEVYEAIRTVCAQAKSKNINALFFVHHEISHTARFGNSSVQIHTSEDLYRLEIEIIDRRKRVFYTYLGELTVDSVQDAFNTTLERLKYVNDEQFVHSPREVSSIYDESTFDEHFLTSCCKEAIEIFQSVVQSCGNTLSYSGSWTNGVIETFCMSTENKNEAYQIASDFTLKVLLKDRKDKWEISKEVSGWNKKSLESTAIIDDLQKKVAVNTRSKGISVSNDTYRVMFGSEALATLIGMAMYSGLNGKVYEEKRGWGAQYKEGDLVFHPSLTVTDNPEHPHIFSYKFDNHGMKRVNHSLITKGCFAQPFYDVRTANKFSKEPTGHTLNGLTLVIESGDGIENPYAPSSDSSYLYIPMLHYVNMTNPVEGRFTGSSRFNAFQVEKGKVLGPLFSTRITETFKQVFANIVEISKDVETVNVGYSYERRMPIHVIVPRYLIAENIRITDSASSF